jgi:hypothetical protein
MAESKAEQIAEAIKTRLEGIAEDGGVTYWFSPDLVLRAPGFTRDCLDSSRSTIYTLVPIDEQVIEQTSGEIQRELVIAIALATKFSPASENPLNPPDPDRWKLQNRMVQDVLKRLLDDSTPPFSWFGSIGVENLEVLLIDMTAENTYELGWAIVLLRIVVKYAHLVGEP